MKLEQLITFLEIAKQGSFSQAAQKIGLTQQALSRFVKTMENQLGVPLFERTSTGSKLSLYGEFFFNFAEKTVYEFQNTVDSFYFIQHENQALTNDLSEFKILTNPIFISTLLPPLVRHLHRIYPNTKFNLYENNTPGIYQYLIKNQKERNTMMLGIGNVIYVNEQLRSESLPPKDSDLTYQRLATGNFVAYVSKNSPLAQYKSISIYEIFKYPLIFYAPNGVPDPNTEAFVHVYGKPHYAILASNMGIITQYIAMNLGVGIMISIDDANFSVNGTLGFFDNLSHKNIVSIPIEEDSRALTLLIHHHGLTIQEPIVQEFLKHLPFPTLL